MAILNSIVKSRFGDYYTIQLPSEGNAQLNLKPESFWNESSTRSFISSLDVPSGYWRDVVCQCSSQTNTSSLSKNEIEQQVSVLLIQGSLNVFPIDVPDQVEHPPEKRAVKSKENITYLFAPQSTLLTTTPKEVKYFARPEEAEEFLTSLDLDQEKLTTLSAELNIDLPSTAKANSNETLQILSSALVAGTTIVMVDRFPTTPAAAEVLEAAGPSTQPAGLGSDTTTKESPAEEESAVDQKSQSETLVKASAAGAAFCEECEKAKKSG